MKRLKRWVAPSFDDDSDTLSDAAAAAVTSKPAPALNTPYLPVQQDARKSRPINLHNKKDCLKRFAPKSIEELAVHAKKVQEVEQWLCKACCTSVPEILLITGPVGCAKTTTVELIAKKYNFKISEWITPVDIELPKDNGDIEYKARQSAIFLDFLLKAANFSSLLCDTMQMNKLVLVKDIPNFFYKNSDDVIEVLHQYKARGKSPLVFIYADTNNASGTSAANLFTNNIKERFSIHHITFNGISTTGLKSALKRIMQLITEKYLDVYNPPSQELIDCLVHSSGGDIRSAVLNMHYSMLKGTTFNLNEQENIDTSRITKGKSKRKKKSIGNTKFLTIGKDQSVSILHGVGRVLNPKLTETGAFVHSPSSVVDQFSTQPVSFVNFLHENYLPHFSLIDEASKAVNCLSDADLMLAEWREKFSQIYGLNVAVAGMIVSNKHQVSGWNPVRGPKPTQVMYPTSKQLQLEEDTLYTGKVLVTDFKTYCDFIIKNR